MRTTSPHPRPLRLPAVLPAMVAAALAALLLVALPAPPAAAQAGPATANLFVTADRCMACHNQLTAPNGEDVSMGSDWRASMMAHSARDPYWQGSLRREVMDHPEAAAAIENECSACHMPMARFAHKAAGQPGPAFAYLPVATLPAAGPMALLAADGVSCAMCHQIQPAGLGTEDSFTAGFAVDTTAAPGLRPAFGPYEVDAGRQRLMRSASQLEPQQGLHVQGSELCASCHTLYTHALGPGGEVVGELPEQVPYLEWRHSDYAANGQNCQSCHMPVVAGEMAISGVVGQPRSQVSRHVFRGGNFFMPRIFARNAGELGVQALPQELDATALRTRQHLQTSSATVRVRDLAVAGGELTAVVEITNLAGHKLPSAYPSRRAWLHLVVRDGGGAKVFESGALRPDGSIAGNDNDADGARFEPHWTEIREPDQVAIFESILGTPDGAVTTGLLKATNYLKDNRLLPAGFDKATAEEDVAVHGRAAEDTDFAGGGDRVRYRVPLAGAEGPFTVEAELWYQPIAYRWAHNLADYDAAEPQRMVRYYDELSEVSGIVLARGEGRVTDRP